MKQIFVILCIAACFSGCTRTPSAHEKAIVQKYDSLSPSAKSALNAKNLVGLTVASTSEEPCAIAVLHQFVVVDGAIFTPDVKKAYVVVDVSPAGYDKFWNDKLVTISVKKKDGTIVAVTNDPISSTNLHAARKLAKRAACVIGVERKTKALAQVRQHQ